MNLYEYCRNHAEDGWFERDTCDNVFDIVVTVVLDLETRDDQDPYDDFIVSIMKRVEVLDDNTVAWSSLIQNNLKDFRDWTRKNWIRGNYKDDDDYIYEWISQIHLLFAGYATDTDYRNIYEFLKGNIPEV